MRLFRFLVFLFAMLIATSSWAVDLAWDHDDPANVNGYIIYYAPTDGSLGPFTISVSDGMTMTVTIPEEHFKPNLEYTIYATAYNLSGESASSNSITYTRHGWGPPPDMPPIQLWIKPGNPHTLREQ